MCRSISGCYVPLDNRLSARVSRRPAQKRGNDDTMSMIATPPDKIESVQVQLVFPNGLLPAKLTLNPELRMSDDEFYNFCMVNPGVHFERTNQGEIFIVPPAGGESSNQSGEAFRQLANWARRDRHGRTFDASVAFVLPTTAILSPDAAWVSNTRLSALSKDQLRKFPPVCPELIVEIMSPSDRLKSTQEKMLEWMRAGVELAWLIDPDAKTVYIYRAGSDEPEQSTGISKLSAEGPVAGFELDLTDIWAGL
jgi:Uma2 family endonuclease